MIILTIKQKVPGAVSSTVGTRTEGISFENLPPQSLLVLRAAGRAEGSNTASDTQGGGVAENSHVKHNDACCVFI